MLAILAQQTQANPIVAFLPLLLMGVVFYFLLIRPQNQRRRAQMELQAAVEVGDEIVTTAGIVAPLLSEGDHSQAFVALVIMAISAGSIFASHVNDGGFWMVAKYFGISERDTLRTWTVLETVLSVAGFVVAAVLSVFV